MRVEDYYRKPFDYKYDNHLMIQWTNRNGLSYYYVYDGHGEEARCIHTWGDGGIYDTKSQYDSVEKTMIVKDSFGNKTIFLSNDAGLVTDTIDPLGNRSSKFYNEGWRTS